MCFPTTPLTRAGPRQPPADDEPTIDDRYAEVAGRVPAFAGVWVDGSRLMIGVTDGSAASARAARDALVEMTGDRDLALRHPVPARATYPFDRLKTWYDPVAYEIMSLPGAVSSDIDERENVLRFGFEEAEVIRGCVELILGRIGVPDDAVVIEQQDPIRPVPLRAERS